MTYREVVREYFATAACGLTQSCRDIHKATDIREDSLSSLLRKMERDEVIGRVENWGPRGGWGYYWIGE